MNNTPAETIAEITNLKTLELYRTSESTFARKVDGILADLSENIIEALDLMPGEEVVENKFVVQLAQSIDMPAVVTKEDTPEEVQTTEPEAAPETDKDLAQQVDDAPSSGGVSIPLEEQPQESSRAGLDPVVESLEPGEAYADVPFVDLLKAWMRVEDINCKGAADRAGVAEIFVDAIVNGNVQIIDEKSKDKIVAAIADGPTIKPSSGGELPSDKRHPLAAEIKAYMKDNNLTAWMAAKHFGISVQTIPNILSGGTVPRNGTIKKVRAVIRKTKPKIKQLRKDPKQRLTPPDNVRPAPVTAKGPARFIQMHLSTWMGRQQIGSKTAAESLHVTESVIRSIRNGSIPHPNILRQLANKIPIIKSNLGYLLKESKKIHG